MWRKWFKWVQYLKTNYRRFILVELYCSDGNKFVRFAEEVYERQVYVKLKTKAHNESMRLYYDGRAGSNYVGHWKQI